MAGIFDPNDPFISSRGRDQRDRPDVDVDVLVNRRSAFLTFLNTSCFGVHVVLLGFAIHLDSPALIVINAISLGLFALGEWCNTKGHIKWAVGAALTEIHFHAIAATVVAGTAWGAQNYLWLGLAFLLVNPLSTPNRSLVEATFPAIAMVVVTVAFPGDRLGHDGGFQDLVVGFNTFNSLLSTGIAVGMMRRTFDEHTDQLEVMATIDPLTEVENRRAGRLHLERLIAEHADEALCTVLADIDHFKAINDSFGHDFGDDVLRAVARSLSRQIRGTDALYRWGGEEFLIVMPKTSLDQGQAVIERLCGGLELDDELVGDQHVTMSFGLSQFRAGEELTTYLTRLDALLYDAKGAGRDRVTTDRS